jgi:Sec-independent protein translocase protein TatA
MGEVSLMLNLILSLLFGGGAIGWLALVLFAPNLIILGNTALGHVISLLKWLGIRGALILVLILMLFGANGEISTLKRTTTKYYRSITKQTEQLKETTNSLRFMTSFVKAQKQAFDMDLHESDLALAEAQKDCSRRVSNAARAQSIPPIKQKVIYVKNEQGQDVPSPIQCPDLYSVRDIQRAVNSN